MKFTAFFLIIAGILLVSCSGINEEKQSEQPQTKSAETNFKSQYPDVKDVTWEEEGELTEAEFEQNGIKISILYDKDGNVIQTETEIEVDQLPESVTAFIAENYPGSEIEEAEKIESTEGNFFEVEIENENDDEVEILFDANGNFVEEIIEAEDEGEDEEEEDGEENEIEIEISELPAGVLEYINQNYGAFTIVEAEKEIIEAGTFYEVELQDPDGEELALIFDEEGNFIEIEVEE